MESEVSDIAGVRQIGRVHSNRTDRMAAPKQGWKTACDATVEIRAEYAGGLEGIAAGQQLWVLTWLHQSARGVLHVHPQDDPSNPLQGVFSTRSADRPNPIGLHRVTLIGIEQGRWLTVRGLEAIDATPVIDIKPLLEWEQTPHDPR